MPCHQLELNIFELLVANLSRLDEKEEADRTGVFQTLGGSLSTSENFPGVSSLTDIIPSRRFREPAFV